ncbi:MAG: trypsin-like peptidase domain-containing protein [Prosthecobacter sp.]|nr:trypsin-like peptidase domain-containing protein [Prosthecobacter sp.]
MNIRRSLSDVLSLAIIILICWPTCLLNAGDILLIGGNEFNTVKFAATLQLDGDQAKVILPTIDELTSTSPPVFKIRSSSGKDYVFESYPTFSKIQCPIAIEANVIYKDKSATLIDYKPNTVGAWERLKNSEFIKANKLVSEEAVAAIDAAAVNLKKSILPYILEDATNKGENAEIGKRYGELTDALEKAFDQTRSFDVKKQLYILFEGVDFELGSWEKFFGYAPVKESSFIQKSATFTPSVTYQGFQELQQPRSPLSDKMLYYDSRACVGIAESEGSTIASGTIIGKRLVLTCSHIVSREDKEGNPPLASNKLVVRIGDDSPPDPDTPYAELSAKIVMQGTYLNNNQTGDKLDFTLLEIDQNEYEAYVTGPLANKPRIEPLSLGYFDPPKNADFYITGHPKGGKKKVTANGKIWWPCELSESEFKRLQQSFIKPSSQPDQLQRLIGELNAKYKDLRKDGKVIYQYRFGKDSPGIGVVCSTVGGNSGGAAITQKVMKSSCVIGILVQGMADSPNAYEPNLNQHEILLPITAIISQADDIMPSWAHDYEVKIYVPSSSGVLELRKNPH